MVFGYRLTGFRDKRTGKWVGDSNMDSIGGARLTIIPGPNKKEEEPNFYGDKRNTSYIYDTYETHVEKVSLDGGVEIGPSRHHPHFHMLLTINHWGYCHVDYFKMNAYLEMMFTGQDPFHRGWDKFTLKDTSGGLFYTEAETPYVDIKVYPQDNWEDIIRAYVRKNAIPGILETFRARLGAV